MAQESEQLPQPESPDVVVTCSNCSGAVQIPRDALDRSVTCPHCSQTFIASATTEPTIIDDTDEEPEEEVPVDDGILDDNRIKQLATLRRSMYRSRSYCIVGIIACIVTSIQLILYAVDIFRENGPRGRLAGFVLCAVAALIAAGFLIRKARVIHREIQLLHHVDEPTSPPDFSTLSDGSQRWKNLEDMSR